MHVTWNTAQHRLFYHPFENKYTIFWLEVLSDLDYEFCSCVEIPGNKILTKYGHLVQWHRDLGRGGGSKDVSLSSPKIIRALGEVALKNFIWGVSNDRESSKPTKIWAPDEVILELLFLGVSNDWASLSSEIFAITVFFLYGLDADLHRMMSKGLSFREKIGLKCVCEGNYFLLVTPVFPSNLS